MHILLDSSLVSQRMRESISSQFISDIYLLEIPSIFERNFTSIEILTYRFYRWKMKEEKRKTLWRSIATVEAINFASLWHFDRYFGWCVVRTLHIIKIESRFSPLCMIDAFRFMLAMMKRVGSNSNEFHNTWHGKPGLIYVTSFFSFFFRCFFCSFAIAFERVCLLLRKFSIPSNGWMYSMLLHT